MRVPESIARRSDAHASAVAPSSRGSCPGSAPARNALASSGSRYPRRTRTLAVVSLTPSAAESALASRCGHGRIVHVPCCIRGQRYAGRRTAPAARRGLLLRQLQSEDREADEERERGEREDDDQARMLRLLERLPGDARPQHDEAGDRARARDDHGREVRGLLEGPREDP